MNNLDAHFLAFSDLTCHLRLVGVVNLWSDCAVWCDQAELRSGWPIFNMLNQITYLNQITLVFVFLESNSAGTDINNSIACDNFTVSAYLPLTEKDYVTHMQGIEVYVKKELLLLVTCPSNNFTSSLLLLFFWPITVLFVVHSFWCCFILHR